MTVKYIWMGKVAQSSQPSLIYHKKCVEDLSVILLAWFNKIKLEMILKAPEMFNICIHSINSSGFGFSF